MGVDGEGVVRLFFWSTVKETSGGRLVLPGVCLEVAQFAVDSVVQGHYAESST